MCLSKMYKKYIFVNFQTVIFKIHINYLTHTLQDMGGGNYENY